MNKIILVINSGSSSIKFSLFSCQKDINLIYHGVIDNIFDSPHMSVFNAKHSRILTQNIASKGHEAGLRTFFNWFEQLPNAPALKGVGHRVVHGGRYFFHPTVVNSEVIEKITQLIPLAPLHQPHNLEAIKILITLYPELPQVVCFDTTFHHSQGKLAKLFAIPRQLTDEGVIRYGFHGISYEYIASVLIQHIGDIGNKRVIVAHLGQGASMCAMYQRKSVATTMGFTALDGLMMGTRCGRIDPGILLYLLQEKHYSVKQLEDFLYNQSGLLGVSGMSDDMRELLSNQDPKAMQAVELFCYRAALEVGSLSVALQGCDAMVFTGGIGENAPFIRKNIGERLAGLGVKINDEANKHNSVIISAKDSDIIVSVIPTNEEYMIAKHTEEQIK